MTIIPAPEPKHACDLPSNGWRGTGHRDGTIYLCPDCKRAWVVRPACTARYDQTWARVGWWNFRLIRRIRKALP